MVSEKTTKLPYSGPTAKCESNSVKIAEGVVHTLQIVKHRIYLATAKYSIVWNEVCYRHHGTIQRETARMISAVRRRELLSADLFLSSRK